MPPKSPTSLTAVTILLGAVVAPFCAALALIFALNGDAKVATIILTVTVAAYWMLYALADSWTKDLPGLGGALALASFAAGSLAGLIESGGGTTTRFTWWQVTTWGVGLLISLVTLEAGRRDRVKRTTVALGLTGAVVGYALSAYPRATAIEGLPDLSGYAWTCWAIGLVLGLAAITQDWRASRRG